MPNTHGWVYCWLLTHVDQRARVYLDMAVIHSDENYRLDISTELNQILEEVVAFRSSWRPPRPRLSLRHMYKAIGDVLAKKLTKWAGRGDLLSL